MKVNIVTSRIEQRLFDELNVRLSRVDQTNLDESHIVIVPPRFSMTTEDQIMNSLPSKGSFNIRVLSFESIANELEKSTLPYLGPEGGVMVLTKILFDHKDELVYFKKSLNVPGFADEMYTTIGKLKLSRISPDNFIDASNSAGKFKTKNREIGHIYKWYEEYTKTRFLDSISRLNNLSIALENDEKIKKTNFYILGYQDFTEQDYILIEKLIQNAKEVFIGVLLNEDNNYVHIYKNEQFKRIMDIVKKCKAQYTVSEPSEKLNPIREKLSKSIFTTHKIQQLKINNEIKVFEGSSKMDECIYAAKQIKNIIENGGRYKDISIVCLNDSYIPYIESIGNVYNIPIYIDKRYVLSNHPLSIYLNELIDIKRYNLKQSDVLSFVKNYFFDEEYFDFEFYVFKRNINRSKFFEKFRGLKEEDLTNEERIREKFEKLVKPIYQLPDIAIANEYISALRQFMVDAKIDERLLELSKELGETSTLAKVNDQILRKINKLIDLASTILGDIEISFNEFAAIFLNGIFVDSASIIPLYLDSVFVGTDRNEYAENKYMIFIGCDSNSFPSVTYDTGIINDDNIAVLKSCGVNFTPTNESKNRSSFVNAHQLLLKATKGNIFTYNNLDGNRPSIVIDDIKRAFKNSSNEFMLDSLDSIDTYSINALKTEYYKYLGKSSRTQEEEDIFVTLSKLIENNKDEKDLLKKNEIKENLSIMPKVTSVSEIETFYKCPYMRFVTYNLKAKEIDKGELDARIWGQITHETLEKFIDRINEVNKENLKNIAGEIFDTVANSDRYFYFTSDAKNKTFLSILKIRSIESCKKVFESLEDSLFKALGEELRFADNSAYRGIVIKGKNETVSLVGQIDRVDTYSDYVRVIDYKSGSKSSASFDLKKLANGTKLQLPIYLKTISDQLDKEPAGAFYMILNDTYTKENNKSEISNFKLEGFFIDDVNIVKAMDTTFSENGSEHLFGVKNTDKGIKGNANNVVLTKEKFDELIETSYQKAVDAVISMEENNIRLNPVDSNTCGYCPYKDICMRNIEEEEDEL